MKNLFNRTLSVLCAVMLLISVVSAWAAAEDEAATPTDLTPAEEETIVDPAEKEIIPEEPGEEPQAEPEQAPEQEPEAEPEQEPEAEPEQEPETEPEQEPEAEPVQEPAEEPEEENIGSVEVVITKTLTVGQNWDGKMKKTKPAILKLDVTTPGLVYMLVEGRDVWATVEKSDRQTENPERSRTDPETGLMVISWEAEEGSYLITLGPVEPNLLAAAKVTFMDQAAYDAWLEEQEAEINSEEPQEAESGESEPVEQEQQENGTEKDPDEEEPEDQNPEEKNKEQEPDEKAMLELGYYKAQILLTDGADLYEDTEEGAEPVEHLDAGAEIWVKKTEKEEWAEVYRTDEEIPQQYLLWESVIIILKPENETTEENAEEEEPLPARYIEITSTLTGMEYIPLGQEITMTAELINFREDDVCSFQWMYYNTSTDTYVEVDGANGPTYTYYINRENIFYRWKLVVTLENEEEEKEDA